LLLALVLNILLLRVVQVVDSVRQVVAVQAAIVLTQTSR